MPKTNISTGIKFILMSNQIMNKSDESTFSFMVRFFLKDFVGPSTSKGPLLHYARRITLLISMEA